MSKKGNEMRINEQTKNIFFSFDDLKKTSGIEERNEKWKRNVENANRRDIAKKKSPNLIVYSDVWMSMMDKNLSTAEGADAIENEKYSAEKKII